MVKVVAESVGKRGIFKNASFSLDAGGKMAVVGANGSGKSTLLRIVAGAAAPDFGAVRFFDPKGEIPPHTRYRRIAWAGPNLEFPPDITMRDALNLHFAFRTPALEINEIAKKIRLQSHFDKKLRHFSSGMLQRFKLGTALFTQSDLLILDEPTAFMDFENARYVWNLIDEHLCARTFVVATNEPAEAAKFDQSIAL